MGVGGMGAEEGDKKLSDEAQNKYKIKSCSNTNSATAESLSGVSDDVSFSKTVHFIHSVITNTKP